MGFSSAGFQTESTIVSRWMKSVRMLSMGVCRAMRMGAYISWAVPEVICTGRKSILGRESFSCSFFLASFFFLGSRQKKRMVSFFHDSCSSVSVY